ncbi:hypothetical protein LP420_13645 [Massilia sp. B-10]|nr:hypothetical protein LP420_13645 [Massilia sp. B-10]
MQPRRVGTVALCGGGLQQAQRHRAVAVLGLSIATRLLRQAIDCVGEQGAKRLITVSPIGIERLLRHTGVHAHRAGPPMIVNGHPIFACWIEVE